MGLSVFDGLRWKCIATVFSGLGQGMYDTPIYDIYIRMALASDVLIAVKELFLVGFLVLLSCVQFIPYATAFTIVN